MNLLALDTSTECATVALSVGETIHQKEQNNIKQHAQVLLPMIQALLTETNLAFADLDGIVFGRGPGSFTGLRIACSVAKGLAFAHDLPLYAVSGLAAIAYQARARGADASDGILAVLDARMHQLYWGSFEGDASSTVEQVSAANELIIDSEFCTLAGVGYDAYLPEFSERLRKKIKNKIEVFPEASAMIRLVLAGAIESVSLKTAEPVYLRNDVAAVKKSL